MAYLSSGIFCHLTLCSSLIEIKSGEKNRAVGCLIQIQYLFIHESVFLADCTAQQHRKQQAKKMSRSYFLIIFFVQFKNFFKSCIRLGVHLPHIHMRHPKVQTFTARLTHVMFQRDDARKILADIGLEPTTDLSLLAQHHLYYRDLHLSNRSHCSELVASTLGTFRDCQQTALV